MGQAPAFHRHVDELTLTLRRETVAAINELMERGMVNREAHYAFVRGPRGLGWGVEFWNGPRQAPWGGVSWCPLKEVLAAVAPSVLGIHRLQ